MDILTQGASPVFGPGLTLEKVEDMAGHGLKRHPLPHLVLHIGDEGLQNLVAIRDGVGVTKDAKVRGRQ